MFDWQVTNEQPSPNWNGLWESQAADFDGGWTIEMRIPFRSIRFKEGGDVWGVNFRRMVRWKNEMSFLIAGAAVVGPPRPDQAVVRRPAGRPRDADEARQPRRQAVRARLGC